MGAFWSMARAMVRSCFCPAEMLGALGENGVKALRQRVDELIEPAGAADLFELLIGDALHVVDEVFPHRALEEPCVLKNHAEQTVHVLAAACRRSGRRRCVMLPLLISKKRMSRLTIVVLPAPVGPTMATFCPGCTSAEKSLMMILSGVVGVAEADVIKVRPLPCTSVELLGLSALVGAFPRSQGSQRCGAPRRRPSACWSCPCAICVSGEVNSRT